MTPDFFETRNYLLQLLSCIEQYEKDVKARRGKGRLTTYERLRRMKPRIQRVIDRLQSYSPVTEKPVSELDDVSPATRDMLIENGYPTLLHVIDAGDHLLRIKGMEKTYLEEIKHALQRRGYDLII